MANHYEKIEFPELVKITGFHSVTVIHNEEEKGTGGRRRRRMQEGEKGFRD